MYRWATSNRARDKSASGAAQFERPFFYWITYCPDAEGPRKTSAKEIRLCLQ